MAQNALESLNQISLNWESFEKMIEEKSKGSKFDIPESVLCAIKLYQEEYKKLNKTRISREKVLLKLVVYGMKGIKNETYFLRQKNAELDRVFEDK